MKKNKSEQFKEDDEKENLIIKEKEEKIIKKDENGENKKINKKEEDNKITDNKQIEMENKIEEKKEDCGNIEEKDKESTEEEENKRKILNFEKKIENYCKEKKILNKEISGISGEGIKELFEDIIIILYSDIQNFEIENKEFDVSLSFCKNLETELNLSSSGRSYHSKDYKKEVNKINKKRSGFCCIRCIIF